MTSRSERPWTRDNKWRCCRRCGRKWPQAIHEARGYCRSCYHYIHLAKHRRWIREEQELAIEEGDQVGS